MHDSSSTPWGTTRRVNASQAPAFHSRAARTPSIVPLVASTYAVRMPKVSPPASARTETWMLLVKISKARPARAGIAIPTTPPRPGWVVAWKPEGRTPEAASGCKTAQTNPRTVNPTRSATENVRHRPPSLTLSQNRLEKKVVQRSSRPRFAVDEGMRRIYERIQTQGTCAVGIPTPCKRQVCGGLPVEKPEMPHLFGVEPICSSLRAVDEGLKGRPRTCPLCEEAF